MTTLIVQLPPRLAVRLAGAADRLDLSHAQLATVALRLFLSAEAVKRTDGRTEQESRRLPLA